MKYFFSIVLLIYVVYTLIYSIRFSIKASHFSGRQKLQHMLLFWLLPFIWTIVVDKQVKSAPEPGKPGRRPSHLRFNHDESGVSLDDGHIHHATDEIDWHVGDH